MTTRSIGKILIGNLFVASAINIMINGMYNTQKMIESKGMPFATIITIMVIIFKLICGSVIAFGNNKTYTNISAFLLIGFTVLTTILYHNAFIDFGQFNNMLKNIAVIGGLLLIIE